MTPKQEQLGLCGRLSRRIANKFLNKYTNPLACQHQAKPPFPRVKDIVPLAILNALDRDEIPANLYRWLKLSTGRADI
jgi:hypothetical protein